MNESQKVYLVMELTDEGIQSKYVLKGDTLENAIINFSKEHQNKKSPSKSLEKTPFIIYDFEDMLEETEDELKASKSVIAVWKDSMIDGDSESKVVVFEIENNIPEQII